MTTNYNRHPIFDSQVPSKVSKIKQIPMLCANLVRYWETNGRDDLTRFQRKQTITPTTTNPNT